MERTTALKRLSKILGKSMGYRVDPKAPTPEEREAARLAITPAIKERDAIHKARDERSAAILAADPEYQRLKAEGKAASERLNKLSATRSHYKITVGTCSAMFFTVKAEGDSWEQIIAKLTEKTPA